MNVIELTQTLAKYVEQINNLRKKYEKVIEEIMNAIDALKTLIKNFNDIVNGAITKATEFLLMKSKQYIDFYKKKLEAKLQKVKDQILGKITDFLQSISDWITNAITKFAVYLVVKIAATFGIPIPLSLLLNPVLKLINMAKEAARNAAKNAASKAKSAVGM